MHPSRKKGGWPVAEIHFSANLLNLQALFFEALRGSNQNNLKTPVQAKNFEYQTPDKTASIANTKVLACVNTLSTGRRRALVGRGAA
jgi:hypothetical protein